MHKMKRVTGVVVFTGWAWLLGYGVSSAQVEPIGFAEMVAAADAIVVAEVVDQRADLVTSGANRSIVTRVTFNVSRTLKGQPRLVRQLEFMGGTVGNFRQEVSGVPSFSVGERGVFFVLDGQYVSPIVGLMQGHFPITRTPDGVEHVTLHDRRAFAAVSQVGAPVLVSPEPMPTMTLRAFEAAITRALEAVGR